MLELYLYLNLKPYIHEWLTHRYGNPVRFPARSAENAQILKRTELNNGREPLLQQEATTMVVIPSSPRKSPLNYHYMSKSGLDCIAKMIENQFEAEFKTEVVSDMQDWIEQKASIIDYMYRNGIDLDHLPTLQQKITRMINEYRAAGTELVPSRRVMELLAQPEKKREKNAQR